MKKYKYIGTDRKLLGQSALGRWIKSPTGPDEFVVQVDDTRHPWRHGWHKTPREDWREMK